MLRNTSFTAEQVAAIVRDYRTAGLDPAEVAVLAFAEKVTLHAYQVTQKDIDVLHTHGFSDADILDIALTAASRSFFSKVVDAIGYEPSAAWLKQVEGLLGPDSYQTLMVGRTTTQPD